MSLNSKIRGLFLGSILAIAAAILVSWLLTNESSPLSEYLLWHPQMRNFWAMLNLPSYILSAIAAGNPHNTNEFVFWTVFLLQWFILGLVTTAVFRTIFRRFNIA